MLYTSKKRINRRSLGRANGETIDETLVVRIPGEFIERERRANHVLDPLATFLIRSRDAEKLELGDGAREPGLEFPERLARKTECAFSSGAATRIGRGRCGRFVRSAGSTLAKASEPIVNRRLFTKPREKAVRRRGVGERLGHAPTGFQIVLVASTTRTSQDFVVWKMGQDNTSSPHGPRLQG